MVLKLVIGNLSHLGKNSKLKTQVKKFSLPSGSRRDPWKEKSRVKKQNTGKNVII